MESDNKFTDMVIEFQINSLSYTISNFHKPCNDWYVPAWLYRWVGGVPGSYAALTRHFHWLIIVHLSYIPAME